MRSQSACSDACAEHRIAPAILFAAQITTTAPATGTYTVIVGSWDGDPNGYHGSGGYILSFVRAPGTFTISAGHDGGVLSNGVAHNGTIMTGDLDTWTFTASLGESIVLSISETSSSSIAPWIRLVSPTGVIIAEGSGFSSAQINATAVATGNYTVIVGSWDGSPSGFAGSGGYVLTRP